MKHTVPLSTPAMSTLWCSWISQASKSTRSTLLTSFPSFMWLSTGSYNISESDMESEWPTAHYVIKVQTSSCFHFSRASWTLPTLCMKVQARALEWFCSRIQRLAYCSDAWWRRRPRRIELTAGTLVDSHTRRISLFSMISSSARVLHSAPRASTCIYWTILDHVPTLLDMSCVTWHNILFEVYVWIECVWCNKIIRWRLNNSWLLSGIFFRRRWSFHLN